SYRDWSSDVCSSDLIGIDVEEHPAEVMQPEHGKTLWQSGDGLFDGLSVLADRRLSAGFDLCDDREPVARRALGVDRAITPLFELEEALFRNRHSCRLRPVLLAFHV